jgi:hypothetical protein
MGLRIAAARVFAGISGWLMLNVQPCSQASERQDIHDSHAAVASNNAHELTSTR